MLVLNLQGNVGVAAYGVIANLSLVLISLLRGIFLIIPLAFLMAHLAGITRIWLTFPLTEVIVCCITLFLLRQTAEQIIS